MNGKNSGRQIVVCPGTSEFEMSYDILREVFREDEVDPRHVFEENLRDDARPYKMLMAAVVVGNEVVASASGSYIGNYGDCEGIGWIEYVATFPEHRKNSHGSNALRKLEETISEEAIRRGSKRAPIFVAHVEDRTVWPDAPYDSVFFWRNEGYSKVLIPFICPCYDFNGEGSPEHEEHAYALMIKAKGKSISKQDLLRVLDAAEKWHLPDSNDFPDIDEAGIRKIQDYVSGVYGITKGKISSFPRRKVPFVRIWR